MEIQRHEQNGIIQGFSFYNETEIVVLQHNEVSYFGNPTRYRGWGNFGAASADAQASAFATLQDAQDFISTNNLVKYGVPVAPFHEDADFQVFLTHRNAAKLAREHPAMAVYINEHEIEMYDEDEGVYFYVSRWEPGHRELVNQYATITPKT